MYIGYRRGFNIQCFCLQAYIYSVLIEPQVNSRGKIKKSYVIASIPSFTIFIF